MEVWKLSGHTIQANIAGAGLAGLSAAITLAQSGIACRLISMLPSERAQSVLAEGGINGALNTMGEDDSPARHFEDTMKAGGYIADADAVRDLADHAPQILLELKRMGAAFNLQDETIQLRNFGGQKKKRTAYARSSTGKILMTTLIDEARKYEAAGLIVRSSHHELTDLLIRDGRCLGLVVRDLFTDQTERMYGPVILATGGLSGFFPYITTGTVTNTGNASALAFARGVRFSNLEMIQYHPTTFSIAGKRCLISEAARGEGGRLFAFRDGKPWYFMEERYPELGNLMPRDVVSREIFYVTHYKEPGTQTWELKPGSSSAFLDLRHLDKSVWAKKLPDLREEILHYAGIDPAKEPVPVEPGIHYFMGGIDVDQEHQTNIRGLFAAGECCSQYHGANRLGGNSTMAAIYGGKVAAKSLAAQLSRYPETKEQIRQQAGSISEACAFQTGNVYVSELSLQIRDILLPAMGIIRNEETLLAAQDRLQKLSEKDSFTFSEKNRFLLAEAMLRSALCRKESRGAHFREDHPEQDACFKGKTISCFDPGEKQVSVGIQLVGNGNSI